MFVLWEVGADVWVANGTDASLVGALIILLLPPIVFSPRKQPADRY